MEALYIGIRDDGMVTGVENTDDIILRMTNAIRDAIRPDVTLFTECVIEEIEGKEVVTVSVSRGEQQGLIILQKRD